MTSNNIDTNALLTYVSQTYTYWGINYIHHKILSNAKNNKPQVLPEITRLLFDLSLLHIFNYQYTMDQLSITFDSPDEMIHIILAHLSECECPYLTQVDGNVGLDFSSSREVLICCGWVMAVSKYFDKIQSKKIMKLSSQAHSQQSIQQPSNIKMHQDINLNKHLNNFIPKNKGETYQKVAQVLKSIQLHQYRLGCLNKKLQKLKNNYKIMVAQANEGCPQNIGKQIIQIVEYQVKNMRNRQYFWIWLDQNVVKAQEKQLKQSDKYQEPSLEISKEKYKQQLVIDIGYLQRFVNACQDYEEKLEELKIKMNEVILLGSQKQDKKNKKNSKKTEKSAQNQFLDQIKMYKQQYQNQNQQVIPSFIGIQLSKYIGITKKAQQEINTQQQENNQQQLFARKKILQSKIRQFISDIQAIKFI